MRDFQNATQPDDERVVKEKRKEREIARKEKKQESRALFGKEEDDAVPFFPHYLSDGLRVATEKL